MYKNFDRSLWQPLALATGLSQLAPFALSRPQQPQRHHRLADPPPFWVTG